MTLISTRLFVFGLLLWASALVFAKGGDYIPHSHGKPGCLCESYEDINEVKANEFFENGVKTLQDNFFETHTIVTMPEGSQTADITTDPNTGIPIGGTVEMIRNNDHANIQLSERIGVCGEPRALENGGQCYPICCPCCEELKVLAAQPEFRTNVNVNGKPQETDKPLPPQVLPIQSTDNMWLCCGTDNSFPPTNFTTIDNTVNNGLPTDATDDNPAIPAIPKFNVHFTFENTDNCHLIGGDGHNLRPFRGTGFTSDPAGANLELTLDPPANYPVRAFCAKRDCCDGK